MREGLSGLTVRGRAFLAAGITAIICSIVLEQGPLARIGVLVAALPLVAAFLIGRSRYRFALVRTLSPTQVEAGQPSRVDLALTNEGRAPTGVLLLEEHLPYVLGNRPGSCSRASATAGAATSATRCAQTYVVVSRSVR